MTTTHVLFEHATGYALFRVKEFEEVASFLPTVEKSAQDLVKFKGIVQLVAFSPFKSAVGALENINSVSEGVIHKDLADFLEASLPKPKKRKSFLLGVSEKNLGSVIAETYGVTCQSSGIVPEVIRGIRLHASSLIEGLSKQGVDAAELSLGRSYSRAKVKFNVNRVDNMIIQSIALIDQLDKDINTFSMRLREWYSYHFPELIKLVNDNYLYAKLVRVIGNRKDKLEDETLIDDLEAIVQDESVAQAIVNAMKSSMGMEISDIDFTNIHVFAVKVISLSEYRARLLQYLQSKMNSVAPNLSTLIGEIVGARLISHAGSLINLAKYPASTVQILGAEKALFRALKSRGKINTPKYGLIFHSSFIGRAGTKNKGRISRFLANKCSIASRIDCFLDQATTVFGEKLKEQVEERLGFYETGATPKKNIDVMKEAVDAVTAEAQESAKKKKKKDKKKKRKADQMNGDDETLGETMGASGDGPVDAGEDGGSDGVHATLGNGAVDEADGHEEETGEPKRKKKKKKHKQTSE